MKNLIKQDVQITKQWDSADHSNLNVDFHMWVSVLIWPSVNLPRQKHTQCPEPEEGERVWESGRW